MAKQKAPSLTDPTVRRVITLIELAATAMLLWFPTMSLQYSEQLKVDATASFFLESTPWDMPFSVLQTVFAAAWAAAVIPLFVKQIDRFWTMAVLGAVAGVSFVGHLALFVTCLFTVGERTYYGLTPQLVPTTAGVLYVLLGVFSLIETVCTCRALRREDAEESEVPCDDDSPVEGNL